MPPKQTDLDWVRPFCELLPNRVLVGTAVERAYDCDAYSVDRNAPMVVALPESTEEVAQIVRFCLKHGVPYTPRGAGTGLSGGAMAAKGGIVISTKRMTKILEVNPVDATIRAQAGCVNSALTTAAQEYGLHFAPDPSSQSVSTLGGNIAENSGGPHTLKYGVTAGHILELTYVDPMGEIQVLGTCVGPGPGIDALGAFIGSEGTLGLVTEALARLTANPQHIETATIAFSSVDAATHAVADIIKAGILPCALEMMDAKILEALTEAFGLSYPPRTAALLLVECDGAADEATEEMRRTLAVCQSPAVLEVSVGNTLEERRALWTARKKGVGAMGRLAPTVITHDGVIPRSKLPEMLEFVYAVAIEYGLGVANIFHAGDGNLHPCFYFDDREPGVIDRVVAAGTRVMKKCLELGGSITGEHGIGVEKIDLMQEMFGPSTIGFFLEMKLAFGSDELCNPCKVIPNQKGCVEHQRRWRGAAL